MRRIIELKPSGATVKSISIEGNIAAGKTTLLNFLSESGTFNTIPEPTEKWRNINGTNLLELMYKNPQKYAFAFQSYVLLTYLEIHSEESIKTKIVERSSSSSRFCFVESLLNRGMIQREQYEVIQKWHEFTERNFKLQPDLIIYLKTTPERAFERSQQRNRPEERQQELETFQQLHAYHENWLFNINEIPVLTLNGDLEPDLIKAEYHKCLRYLNLTTDTFECD